MLADAGFPGVGIVLEGELETLRVPAAPSSDAGEIVAGAAVALPVLARQAAAAGWSGLEFYVGIPGSVGGAVRMNAGGHGHETVEVLRRAEVVALDATTDGARTSWRDTDALDLSYRHSAIGTREVVVGAAFTVAAGEPAECVARVDEIVRSRGAPTSPAVPMRARCSATHRATARAASSMPRGSRALGSAALR